MFEKQIGEIRNITDIVPKTAVILGSGLGGFAKCVEVKAEINYSDITDMPVSTAPKHEGKFVFGEIDGKSVVLMNGRVHLYEGYTAQQTAMPIRILRLLGVENLILTNAAGGINKSFNVGDFMMISDHISAFVPSPLIGPNDDAFGERFPEMTEAYSKELQKKAKSVAIKSGIELKQGVYAQLTGPQYETPAEIKMLSTLGTDAVGMSTVTEAIAAVHCKMKVCGISLITNLACGVLDTPLPPGHIESTANKVAPDFERLIKEIIKAI